MITVNLNKISSLFSLLLAVFFIFNEESSAIIIDKNSPDSLEAGISYFDLEGPTQSKTERTGYHLLMRSPLPTLLLSEQILFDVSINYLPDSRQTKSVSITQDFYLIAATVNYEYINLLRYRLGIGPLFSYDQTSADILGAEYFNSGFDYGAQVKAGIDYSFSSIWDLRFHAGYNLRLTKKRNDFFYGIALGKKL
jgi:hypothetical protein